MYIANIYSWDRFDNELQMLVIIFDDWRLGVMVPSPPKALKILTPESTRKHGELTLAYKPKQFFLLFQQKKKKKREKGLTALASHLGLQQRCHGKVTDGCSTGRSAISARCTMPSNTSTIQGNSCDIAAEPCHLTTIHKRARQQAKVSRSDLQSCGGEKKKKKKKKEAGGSARGLSQMELGLRPTFCHCTSTTVAPGYK